VESEKPLRKEQSYKKIRNLNHKSKYSYWYGQPVIRPALTGLFSGTKLSTYEAEFNTFLADLKI